MDASWINGLIGGVLIGCAGAIYLLVNGRIMGASGIIGGLVDGSARAMWKERGAFLLGLFALPALLAATVLPSQTNLTPNLIVVAIAGVLVGVGTRIANGCTSGHGVCGISRLSLRGIVATIFYILAGGLTVVLFRHILGVI
ncbi:MULTISPECIES: YeeE/YedE family protein [Halocynthiibacter]|uniref:YeeE/YedE family protein n=1 Tax=Halocynthiibacter halioticoli TaxID=2986804 RepID=A0AAE3LQV6_9RHOB|nr:MULTISPECIES: YeeE/YedE family protein [Halocynthiibacter]MCV6823948.1 YeeE/YedE family protein [Halocynthiibacter halioticoli]MCW4056949.1 YeeE/YedE family protein [Halocynthiibacter sp. SDUM655004]MDE0590033.1 YeeE/YedE family protein [Halocynthiibacter sp. C4]